MSNLPVTGSRRKPGIGYNRLIWRNRDSELPQDSRRLSRQFEPRPSPHRKLGAGELLIFAAVRDRAGQCRTGDEYLTEKGKLLTERGQVLVTGGTAMSAPRRRLFLSSPRPETDDSPPVSWRADALSMDDFICSPVRRCDRRDPVPRWSRQS